MCVKSEELASEGASPNTSYCITQTRKQALQWVWRRRFRWQAEHIEERVTEKCRWRQRNEGRSVAEILANVPHRWLEEASVLYLYLLITCCAWLHTFSSLPLPTLLKRWICLTWNNTSPFFTPSNLCQQHSTMGPLFMDWQFKSMKAWDEVRGEKDGKLPLLSFTFTVRCLFVCGNWPF